jgi:hypothetical protein
MLFTGDSFVPAFVSEPFMPSTKTPYAFTTHFGASFGSASGSHPGGASTGPSVAGPSAPPSAPPSGDTQAPPPHGSGLLHARGSAGASSVTRAQGTNRRSLMGSRARRPSVRPGRR